MINVCVVWGFVFDSVCLADPPALSLSLNVCVCVCISTKAWLADIYSPPSPPLAERLSLSLSLSVFRSRARTGAGTNFALQFMCKTAEIWAVGCMIIYCLGIASGWSAQREAAQVSENHWGKPQCCRDHPTHTPSIAFRHFPPSWRKDVVNQCLEFASDWQQVTRLWPQHDRLQRTSSAFVTPTSCPFFFAHTFKSKI